MRENKLYTLGCILFIIALYACILGTSIFGNSGSIVFFQIGALTLPSLVLFMLICFLGIWRRKYFFLFLVFVILAFPAPIDDLFTSVILTNPDDRVEVVFPMVTRIDIYLLLGIFLKISQKPYKMATFRLPLLMKLFLLLYALVMLSNAIKSRDLWDFNLLLAYTFHIRYFILFLLLLNVYDIRKYQKPLIWGFVLSVVFLFIEAYINTAVKGSDRFLSGSLSLNTFANITAAIMLYMVYLLKYRQISRVAGLLTLLVGLAIIIGSGTRTAFLTLLLSYGLIYLLENHRQLLINSIKIFLGIIVLSTVYFFASENKYIPERYSYEEISDKINIDFSKEGLSKMIEVKGSEETTSIRTRINLFESSLYMIKEHPLSGIGAGRWNRYKNDYSKERAIPKVLLDTHNDYLALMSQYGVLLGLFFAVLVFLSPFYMARKMPFNNNNGLKHLYVINFAMGIAALSNAGLFKHQVSAILILIVVVTMKLFQEYEHA